MADSHAKMTQTTPQEVIVSVIAGLLAPLLAIALIVMLVLSIQRDQLPDATPEAAEKATLQRIQPVARLAALDASAPRVEKSGQEVYAAVCAACHDAGVLDAPKFDARGDWASRLGQGYDTLVKHAIEGIRQMPARGGDSDLSDFEMASAVVYLANSAGANFKAPESAAPAADATPVAPAPEAQTASAPAADLTHGQQIYRQSCALCHESGVAGAPKPGDTAAWGPRLAQGMDALYTSSLHGKGAMPAKGGNPALSDSDVKAAVDYMTAQSR